MFKCCVAVVTGWVAFSLSAITYAKSFEKLTTTKHSDKRATIKIDLNPRQPEVKSGLDFLEVAKATIALYQDDFKINETISPIKFQNIKSSLSAQHYYFQQYFQNTPVDSGEVIVSIDSKTGQVMRVFNNYYPIRVDKLSAQKELNHDLQRKISQSFAFDAAWTDLHVTGKLLDDPRIEELVLVSDTGVPRHVYKTFLNVANPFGAWEHVIDAGNGKIISRRDTRIQRKGSSLNSEIDSNLESNDRIIDRSTPILHRERAFEDRAKLKRSLKGHAGTEIRSNGEALVFDPDPRTTLNDFTLQDDSSSTRFEGAYFKRTLKDLLVSNGIYSLVGPWIRLADFESPTSAPTTNSTGIWDAKRGQLAFNDVMTYFHVDQSQRYIQSLGFTGEKGIQAVSIEVDANGVNGEDNSHYIPISNRMAFGHGCVDDNEDADVILHEYGHAITYSINKNFRGGDTGAIGEGFGDYWAASYSLSVSDYRVNEVFSWDGHGEGKKCWAGRYLNATELVYQHNQTYSAHQSIGRGRYSDELWSTPLFQALLDLKSQGVSREIMDQIVLEAQFGLGANIKMRDLALSMIKAAEKIGGTNVAKTIANRFKLQNIIEAPFAEIAFENTSVSGMGSNGVPEPGETLAFTFTLFNTGNAIAKTVSVSARSSTPDVEIISNDINLGDIDAGSRIRLSIPVEAKIRETIGCGARFTVFFEVKFENGRVASVTQEYSTNVGTPIQAIAREEVLIPIPDDNATGLSRTLEITHEQTIDNSLQVELFIEHPYASDLTVTLESPAKKSVVLHQRFRGERQKDIKGIYPISLTPFQSLTQLSGDNSKGTWKLTVTDTSPRDVGKLRLWGISMIKGYSCE